MAGRGRAGTVHCTSYSQRPMAERHRAREIFPIPYSANCAGRAGACGHAWLYGQRHHDEPLCPFVSGYSRRDVAGPDKAHGLRLLGLCFPLCPPRPALEHDDGAGAKMQEIALAWHWAKGVASPIVGATKVKYLDDAANALDVSLTDADIAYLEDPYMPHRIVGAICHNPSQGVMLLDEKR